MNTLYININGENPQSTNDIIVVGRPEDAIINKFFFELGKEILKKVVVTGVTSIKKKDIVTDFKAHDEKSFNNILEQWKVLKQELLGEHPSGSRAVKLPDEYISWLHNSSHPAYAEIAKSLYQRGGSVEVSLDKIYKNAIGIIVNNIDPEECKDCGMFVVNDDAVTDDSAITGSIQERIPKIAFVPFEDFGKCPKCRKNPCECKDMSQKRMKKSTKGQIGAEYIFAVGVYNKKREFKFGLVDKDGKEIEGAHYFRVVGNDAFLYSKYYIGSSGDINNLLHYDIISQTKLCRPLLGYNPSDRTVSLITKNGAMVICDYSNGYYMKGENDYHYTIEHSIRVDSFPWMEFRNCIFLYDGNTIIKGSYNDKEFLRKSRFIPMYPTIYERKRDKFQSLVEDYLVEFGKIISFSGSRKVGFDLLYEDLESDHHKVKHFDYIIEEARMFSENTILLSWKKGNYVGENLIRLNGKEVLPLNRYSRYEKLSESFFKALDVVSLKWGVFDIEGNVILAPKYDGIAIIDY